MKIYCTNVAMSQKLVIFELPYRFLCKPVHISVCSLKFSSRWW